MRQTVMVQVSKTLAENWQIALIGVGFWSLHAENAARVAVRSACLLPVLNCPLIDYSQCDMEKVNALMKRHFYPGHSLDVDVIIREFEAIGAVVSYPVPIG